MKDMSKININDIEEDFEDEDDVDATDHEDRVSRRQKNWTRRKIEYLTERKKLREMLYTDDSYWGD
jgi:hypothetical protein